MSKTIDNLRYILELSSFRKLEHFCLFVGYPRSGHSLLGALMDAHPAMIISHEEDALAWMIQGYGYRPLFARILANSRRFAKDGRSWSGYPYAVKGQWQGRFQSMKVIGDKRGGRTSLLLISDHSLLQRFIALIPLPVKIIHVVRNPFDNVVTRARQGSDKMLEITEDAIWHNIRLHFQQAEVVQQIISGGSVPVLTLRHELLISDPDAVLEEVCRFFHLEAPADWLAACSALVFKNPRRTRDLFRFTPEMIEEINSSMKNFRFFDGYTFED